MSDFGRAMLAHFPLEPGGVYLNHGTVGVTPLVVMRARAALLDEIERHPARFMIRELMNLGLTPPPEAPRLRAAADAVAAFLGVDGDGLAFVDNATSGINAVLRSFALAARRRDADPRPGLRRRRPRRRLHRPRARRDGRDRRAAVSGARSGRVRSRRRRARSRRARGWRCSITSPRRPRWSCRSPRWRRRAARAACRCSSTAPTRPAAIELDIAALGVDWYAANLHKWAFAPRSCGVLWAAPERRAALHPGVISWGVTNDDWLQEFDWTGTRDPSPWLAAPAGLDFMRDVLGVAAMREHNHRLAWQSAPAPGASAGSSRGRRPNRWSAAW